MCERPPELDGLSVLALYPNPYPPSWPRTPPPTHTHTHTHLLDVVVVVVRVHPTHTFKRTYLHIRCQCPSIPHRRRRLNCVCPLKERPKMKVLSPVPCPVSLVSRPPPTNVSVLRVRPLASLKICSWHEHMWRNFVADFCSLTGQGDCVH